MERDCCIVSGSVGHDETAGDDGAYDLLDVSGSPEEVGRAIAESLATCDLTRGGSWGYLEHGRPVYVTVTVRIMPKQPVGA